MDNPIVKTQTDSPAVLSQNGFSNPVTLNYAKREVTLHSVTETELDTVASLSNSIHLAFLGMSFGAFLTLLITLTTVPITSPSAFAAYVSAAMLSGIMTLFFGVNARISYKEAQTKLNDMKRNALASKQR